VRLCTTDFEEAELLYLTVRAPTLTAIGDWAKRPA
jgi:hypothetical protein